MSVRVHAQRFARKFIFDVMPGALASLVGALFFAQQWTQAPMRTEVARVTAQNEQIVTMMREEQTLMRAVIEREHESAAQRQPPAVRDAKNKDKVEADRAETDKTEKTKVEKDRVETTGAAPARRRVEPAREVVRAVPASTAPSPVGKPVAETEAETVESGPLVAPQADQGEGVITRIVSVVAALTTRTMDANGVRPLPGLMPGAPVPVERFDPGPSGHMLDTNR